MFVGITGAMSTTSGDALNAILKLCLTFASVDKDQWLGSENGSKPSDGRGSGWYLDEGTKYSYATGQMATVFLAEVYAILNVAN